MTPEYIPSDGSPSLETSMERFHPGWGELSEGERGQLLIEWLREYLQTGKAEPLGAILQLGDTNAETLPLRHDPYYSAPTNSVAKDDLLHRRPDLAEQIKAESEVGLVDYVADKVGDALQDLYWEAVDYALTEYFGICEPDEDESSSESL